MKKIGLLGGLSPESTVEYYKIINSEVRKVLGGCSSAELIIESFNFREIEKMQFLGKWDELGEKLTHAAKNLEKCGADYIVICTNLMHKVAPYVKNRISVPLIHMVDSVAQDIQRQNMNKVGLLGTIFTMEEDFYSKKLLEDYSIETIIPDSKDRQEISRIIYEELCCGIIDENSRKFYLNVIDKMKQNGAQGVILGCTEIPLMIQKASIPIFNTTRIHAKSVVEKILEKEPLLLA
ncbi:MAG TPA: aspartate/glutamate racemase family protein [Candidatus Gastranaerophilaceae bacterium]|nr:aspartate/glutamate racemase family protein [Candidatus Gastranaerophilaceae bacterium]